MECHIGTFVGATSQATKSGIDNQSTQTLHCLGFTAIQSTVRTTLVVLFYLELDAVNADLFASQPATTGTVGSLRTSILIFA